MKGACLKYKSAIICFFFWKNRYFFRYEVPELQQKVTENFERLFDGTYWQRVDADMTEDDLQAELSKIAVQIIDNSGENPLQLLW